MVFPLFDDNRDRRRFPFVNVAFIVINAFVFLVPQGASERGNAFTLAWSTVPEEIRTGQDISGPVAMVDPRTGKTEVAFHLEPTPFSVYLTLLTSMFMHGGWAHIIGNMLFLWIFGDNVEDYLGHVRYFLFYLLCGFMASLTHVAVTFALDQNPFIPSLGASGAISGVLGGYVLLHPNRPVTVILFRFLTTVPAYMAIGIWFVFQLIEGLGMLGGKMTGVAYGAHIGGFLFGLATVRLFAAGLEPETYRRAPPRDYFR